MARKPSVARDGTAELRGFTPKEILAVIDAICISRNCDRFVVVNEVLLVWARRMAHEATVINNVTRGNPQIMDSQWQKPAR